MTPRNAAASLLQSLNPRHRPLSTMRVLERFAAEVQAEAGSGVLADVVSQVRLHSALTRGILPGSTMAEGLDRLRAAVAEQAGRSS